MSLEGFEGEIGLEVMDLELFGAEKGLETGDVGGISV